MLNVGNQRREVQGQRHGGISMLSMYNEPPLVEVSLEEFEEFAIDRLHGTNAAQWIGALVTMLACTGAVCVLLQQHVLIWCISVCLTTTVLKAVENFRLRSVAQIDRETRLDKTLNKHLPLRPAAPGNPKRAEMDVVRSLRIDAAVARGSYSHMRVGSSLCAHRRKTSCRTSSCVWRSARPRSSVAGSSRRRARSFGTVSTRCRATRSSTS